MLERSSQKGMFVPWPTKQIERGGAGAETTQDIEELPSVAGRYLYVPFVKNAINYAPSQGCDVISYNFSGCLMVAYTLDGQRRVGHVSTGEGQDCKGAWAALKARASDVIEFKPSDGIALPQGFGGRWGCYGLITSDNRCYSIVVGRGSTDASVVLHQVQMN